MRRSAALILIVSILSIPFTHPVLGGQFEDATAAYNRGDYGKAYRLFKPLAENGMAEAQYELGELYRKGQGVSQDYTETAKWWRKAAEQGLAEAQYNLGVIYHEGIGVPKNYDEAVKLYRLAAEQGYAPGQFNLGVMYFYGQGVPHDLVLSYMWFNLAASRYPASDTESRDNAVQSKDLVASKMTPAQIAEAERLAREWKPKKEGKAGERSN